MFMYKYNIIYIKYMYTYLDKWTEGKGLKPNKRD